MDSKRFSNLSASPVKKNCLIRVPTRDKDVMSYYGPPPLPDFVKRGEEKDNQVHKASIRSYVAARHKKSSRFLLSF